MSVGISAQIVEKSIVQNGINIVYPQVTGLANAEVQERINRAIEDQVLRMMAEQRQWPDASGMQIQEMVGVYTIGVNKNGVLSVRLENYMYPEGAAHGTTLVKSVTVDLETGKVYTLGDLFQRGSGYITVLNQIIRRQFQEKDLPMINEFRGITVNQDYYLTPKNLVIYFQAYEYTPGYVGIPEFEIPFRTIINYINEEGPIGRLMSERTEQTGISLL